MIYREATCKTALSKSSLPGLDYSLNPYTGCEHACAYCYAPSTLRYAGNEPWGSFVTAKTNIPVILEKEARKLKPGIVGISTVTDPYQPLENRLKLTRSCLEVLRAKNFSICIQTKSALVRRDIDIIKEFRDPEIGFTITGHDDVICSILEPGASPISERLRAMRELSDAGIRTWAFIGPILPGLFSEADIDLLLLKIKEAGASRILYDRLRPKPGINAAMLGRLNVRPDLKTALENALSDDTRQSDSTGQKIRAKAIESGMNCDPAF